LSYARSESGIQDSDGPVNSIHVHALAREYASTIIPYELPETYDGTGAVDFLDEIDDVVHPVYLPCGHSQPTFHLHHSLVHLRACTGLSLIR